MLSLFYGLFTSVRVGNLVAAERVSSVWEFGCGEEDESAMDSSDERAAHFFDSSFGEFCLCNGVL